MMNKKVAQAVVMSGSVMGVLLQISSCNMHAATSKFVIVKASDVQKNALKLVKADKVPAVQQATKVAAVAQQPKKVAPVVAQQKVAAVVPPVKAAVAVAAVKPAVPAKPVQAVVQKPVQELMHAVEAVGAEIQPGYKNGRKVLAPVKLAPENVVPTPVQEERAQHESTEQQVQETHNGELESASWENAFSHELGKKEPVFAQETTIAAVQRTPVVRQTINQCAPAAVQQVAVKTDVDAIANYFDSATIVKPVQELQQSVDTKNDVREVYTAPTVVPASVQMPVVQQSAQPVAQQSVQIPVIQESVGQVVQQPEIKDEPRAVNNTPTRASTTVPASTNAPVVQEHLQSVAVQQPVIKNDVIVQPLELSMARQEEMFLEPVYPEPVRYEQVRSVQDEPRLAHGTHGLYFGPKFQHLYIDGMDEAHWILPYALASFNFAYKTFKDDCEDAASSDLASLIFGKECVQLQDIYLMSRLAAQNKLRRAGCTPLPVPGCGDLPITPIPNDVRSNQFLSSLAPMEICFSADQREFKVDFGAVYRFCLCEDWLSVYAGFNVPVKYATHILDYQLVGGRLYSPGTVATNFIRENPLTLLFANFNSVEDFVERAVFQPKGITLKRRQHRMGIGDVSLFGVLDAELYCAWDLHAQVGLRVEFPTSKKANCKTLWEPILGNNGAYRITPSLTLIAAQGNCYLNPFIYVAGSFSPDACTTTRIPAQVSVSSTATCVSVLDVPGLLATVGRDLFVTPFNELDSTIPAFANTCFNVEKKLGNEVNVALGNYFYNPCCQSLRFGLFYDYTHTSGDEYEVKCDNGMSADLNMVNCQQGTDAHRIAWQARYKPDDCFEFDIGSSHVVAGKRVARTHEIYCAVAVTF